MLFYLTLFTFQDNCAKEDKFVSLAHVSGGRGKSLLDQGQELNTIVGGKFDSEESKKVVPLYQRVLSALIMEDETEEFEEDNGSRFMYFQDNRGYSLDDDLEQQNIIRGPQCLQQCSVNGFSYNDRGNNTTDTISPYLLSPEDQLKGNRGVTHLNNGFSENGFDGPLSICTNVNGVHSFDCSYEQLSVEDKLLLELQSVGLYPDTVVSRFRLELPMIIPLLFFLIPGH